MNLSYGLFLVVSISLLIVSSCTDSSSKLSIPEILEELKTEFDTVKVDSSFSLLIPDYMNPTSGLHDRAVLEYNNPFEERAIIVIPDNESGGNLKKFASESSTEWMNYLEFSGKLSLTESDSLITTSAVGKTRGYPASRKYFFAFVEQNRRLFQIVGWCRQEFEGDFEKEFEVVAKSFAAV